MAKRDKYSSAKNIYKFDDDFLHKKEASKRLKKNSRRDVIIDPSSLDNVSQQDDLLEDDYDEPSY